MQTFLPYTDFKQSAECLDYRRLGKQRVEAFQILKAISDPAYGWQNHPCVKQWRAYPDALVAYYDVIVQEWIRRGYKNNMPLLNVKEYVKPWWLGYEEYHASHRSNLLRKNFEYYSRFGWVEDTTLDYVWIR